MLAPETAAAATLAGANLYRLDPGRDHHYAALLMALWRSGTDVTILEQDVVPPPGWLSAFEACPAGWCVIEPELRPGVAWFGCVRWRAEWMAEHSTLMADAQADNSTDGDRLFTWRKVDVRFERTARAAHLAPCFHGPRCRHLRAVGGR